MYIDIIGIFLIITFGVLCFLFVYIYNKGNKSLLLYSFLLIIIHTIIFNTSIMARFFKISLLNFVITYSLLSNAIFISYFSFIWFLFIAEFTGKSGKIKNIILLINFTISTINCVYTVLSLNGYRLPITSIVFTATKLIYFSQLTYCTYLLIHNTVIKKAVKEIFFAIPSTILLILLFAIYQTGWVSQHNLLFQSLSIILTLITLVLFIPGLYKHPSFSNLISLSLSSILNSMEAGIVAVDFSNNILLINNAFKKFLIGNKDNASLSYKQILDILSEKSEKKAHQKEVFNALLSTDITDYNGELSLNTDQIQYFNIKIEAAHSRSKEIYGRIITFTNITWYKKSINQLNKNNQQLLQISSELDTKNNELEELNKQIVIYTQNIEALISERERRKISKKIYSLLEKTFKSVIESLEHIIKITNSESTQALNKLNDTIQFIRQSFKQVNLTIRKLLAKPVTFRTLDDAINDLSHNFALYKVNIEFFLDPNLPKFNETWIELMYTACEIAFNNSIIHGKANEINVLVKNYITDVKLFIFDNGKGCTSIKPGESLSWLNDRFIQMNGSIKYGSDGSNGFNIIIEIPKESNLHHNRETSITVN